MSMTWNGASPPPSPSYGPMSAVRILFRGTAVLATIAAGLMFFLPLRLIEQLIFGPMRPYTSWVTQSVCRLSLFWFGIKSYRSGNPMIHYGASVANHSSWLDIFVLNASDRIIFVSKSEVSNWPGIGFLARVTGTLFIARNPRAAKLQALLLKDRLLLGQRLLFFPEGTSTDGQLVLPFKTSLFASLLESQNENNLYVQPISIIYHSAQGQNIRTYGWWGDMNFGGHLLKILALQQHGSVEVVYHPPLSVAKFSDRKTLARATETKVRSGHTIRCKG